MQPTLTKRIAFKAALALCLAWPALAQAVKVGTVGVKSSGASTVLNVATEGKVEPQVSVLDGAKALIVVPGGVRSAMAPLKVSSGIVKGIRFGSESGDLRIVIDLKKAGAIKLGAVTDKGFEVTLAAAGAPAPVAAAPAKAEAPNAEAEVAALNPASAAYTYRIVDLSLGGDEDQGELTVSSDGPASYKSSLKEDGKVVSLSFRNSSLAWSGDSAKLTDRSVSGVTVRQVSEGGESVVKVDVHLREKLAYNLKRDQNQLVLHFSRPMVSQETARKGDIKALVSLDVEDADVVSVVKALCQQAGFEYQFTKDILSKAAPENLVTFRIKDRPFEEVVNTILAQVACNYVQEGNSLYIGSLSEIEDKRKRLPSVQRFYEPKYMSPAQLMALVQAHFSRDTRLQALAVYDPTNHSRFMLVGTAQDVADVFKAFAIYDVPEAGDQAASTGDGGNGQSVKTQVYHLQYLDSSNSGLISGAIAQLYEDSGETPPVPLLDSGTRTMVITTRMKYLRKIEKLLARLDVKPEQVNIEGKIVEVNQGMSQQLGINWSANNDPSAKVPNVVTVGPIPSGGTVNITTLQNAFNINATIQALLNDHKADLVSAPNITTNDNQPATISTTDIHVSVQSTTVVTNGVVTTSQTFPTSNIPLSLVVTPRISKAERRVLMNINFNLTTPSGSAPAVGAPQPTSTQNAVTNVSVNSGDTAVIGGLVRQSNTETETKVPVLGDIPLLGLLFKSSAVIKEKKEVIIFITPSIVEE